MYHWFSFSLEVDVLPSPCNPFWCFFGWVFGGSLCIWLFHMLLSHGGLVCFKICVSEQATFQISFGGDFLLKNASLHYLINLKLQIIWASVCMSTDGLLHTCNSSMQMCTSQVVSTVLLMLSFLFLFLLKKEKFKGHFINEIQILTYHANHLNFKRHIQKGAYLNNRCRDIVSTYMISFTKCRYEFFLYNNITLV